MSDPIDPLSGSFLRTPRPWAFSRSELAAGLRRLTGDQTLQLDSIQEYDIPRLRPSIGRLRGLQVSCFGTDGQQTFDLVLKEPLGTTRTGTAGVGLREASVYRVLSRQIPLQVPELLAAHPLGEWLIFQLLPPGVDAQNWSIREYHLALDNLITLHDRFWGLGKDLAIYNWLARPLDQDFDIYVTAAATGVERLVRNPSLVLSQRDPDIFNLLGRLVVNADRIAANLQQAPSTMIHGDFFPGNLIIDPKGKLVAFDWQQAGIAPGILDLVSFVQGSLWWYDPIPLDPLEITNYYREGLRQANGYSWQETEWEALWDYGLLWTFLAHWIDLISAIPESLIETRYPQFESIWLDPLRMAAERQNIPIT